MNWFYLRSSVVEIWEQRQTLTLQKYSSVRFTSPEHLKWCHFRVHISVPALPVPTSHGRELLQNTPKLSDKVLGRYTNTLITELGALSTQKWWLTDDSHAPSVALHGRSMPVVFLSTACKLRAPQALDETLVRVG